MHAVHAFYQIEVNITNSFGKYILSNYVQFDYVHAAVVGAGAKAGARYGVALQ